MNYQTSRGYVNGHEKARRLSEAARKGGIVRVSDDGTHVWVFATPPSTLTEGGAIFDAQEFVFRAADTLKIQPGDVFHLDDDTIRDLARRFAGFTSGASHDVRGASRATEN